MGKKTRHLGKPFPRMCPACGEKSVLQARISHTTSGIHDNRQFSVTVPDLIVTKCQKCNEVYFGRETDSQLANAVRQHLGLLTPEEIRAKLLAIGITQKKLAGELSIAEETLSRWLSGAIIPSANNDNRLRRCLETLSKDAPLSRGCRGDTAALSSSEFASLWQSHVRIGATAQQLVASAHSTWGMFCYEEVA